ncbi:MAG: ABC transporter permease subunit [Candidatus Zixiibacteriota bacterium]
MLGSIIEKELKGILQSPKFFATFAVCSLLMLLSVYIGVKEYNAQVEQYENALSLNNQQLAESTSWRSLNFKAYRKPEPMQIFVSGLSNDIGRWTSINQMTSIKLQNSIYSDDPIFSVFRFIDFAFIVQVVLSLFAILFTYDAVSGERESGTLKLVFSNAVKRTQYIVAKMVGSWLGLVIPMLIPILLSILLVIIMGVSLTAGDWLKLMILVGLSLLLFTFFIVFGVLVSCLTRHSNISFLVSLVSWVLFVLIIPRAGVMMAGQFVPVPRVAEIEGQRDAFAKDLWATFYEESMQRWDEFNESANGDGGDEDSGFEMDDELLWARMQEEDSARKVVDRQIEEYEIRLQEELRQRKTAQERLAFSLSRFSPTSAYQLAAMTLAGTDIELKARNLDVMQNYRNQFVDYTENKIKETNDLSGVMMVEINSEEGIKINNKRNDKVLDVSDMPQYVPSDQPLSKSLASIVVDGGILGLFILLGFAGAFIRMLRYDVR